MVGVVSIGRSATQIDHTLSCLLMRVPSSGKTSGGAGLLFGLTVPPGFDGIYFVDDGDNTLRVLAPPM